MKRQQLEIIVGEGTCGIAAGAHDVLKTFQEMLPDAAIYEVGCKGMCHREVVT